MACADFVHPHLPQALFQPAEGLLTPAQHLELVALHHDNQRAIEDAINGNCCDECGGSSCYVEHREATQTIDPPGGGAGDRVDLVKITPWDTNICGTAPADDAMLILHLNWSWNTSGNDPYISDITGGGLATVSGRFVGVWPEGLDISDQPPIALDTRLGLGAEWYYDGSQEGGSLTIPLNIYPAGADFDVWVGQSSDAFLDITIRADLYTVGSCSCVL